jgi:hypothetical protein
MLPPSLLKLGPLHLQLDETDDKKTWNLNHPIPRLSLLNQSVDLPEMPHKAISTMTRISHPTISRWIWIPPVSQHLDQQERINTTQS